MAARRRGSKLNKSETVQVRFDPILKWAAEIAAGKERRSLSSYIEMAVEQAVKRGAATQVISTDDSMKDVSAWDIAYECWNLLPMLRLKALAEHYPGALTTKERVMMQGFASLFAKHDVDWLCRDPQVWMYLEKFGSEEISLNELQAAVSLYSYRLDREDAENERQIAESLAASSESSS